MADRTITKEQMREIFLARERIVKEQFVKVAELQIVREELTKCQETEGTNALSECAWLAKKYIAMIKSDEYRVRGWKKIDTA
ncbi:putative NADH-ubiquinone oxidoreductase 12 kDa subunit [Calocera viscosa TUFC12733]|uniref:Putative NADH-ubiquinone oxidoreductase 12 kDa subunit n=1 Tax=Calocera viscosa (strain TUFC12733) TaxID=1330018 RepID=A0A167M2E3_CALVF|nr:putative NADH-ubiquinone oxidoreductase 12 kDa subunit [Calocera viscosa TUFC12733]